MKRCSYCGAENPDDATACRIDQQPFEPERIVTAAKPLRPKPVRVKRSRAEIRAHLAARPLTVKLGVALLVISEVAYFVQAALGRYSSQSGNFDTYLITAITFAFRFCLPPLVIYFAFRGHNWARWTLLFAIVLGLITEPWNFSNLRLDSGICLYSIVDIASMVLLFQRASSQWYKGRKKILNPPAPAS